MSESGQFSTIWYIKYSTGVQNQLFRVELELGKGWELVAEVAAPTMQYNVSSTIYSVLSVPEDLTECVTSMAATLKFTVKDCDPATGEPDSDEVSLTLRGQSQEP